MDSKPCVCAQNKGVKEMDGDLCHLDSTSKTMNEGFSVIAGWHTAPEIGHDGSIFSELSNMKNTRSR
jgi:hypothetical protein